MNEKQKAMYENKVVKAIIFSIDKTIKKTGLFTFFYVAPVHSLFKSRRFRLKGLGFNQASILYWQSITFLFYRVSPCY